MKRLIFILLILISAGILLLVSTFWSFNREQYVNDFVMQVSRPLSDKIDVEYLKKEFDPAYGL